VKAYGGADPVEAALRDWRSAPLEPRVRAMLAFLEKQTLLPGELGPADIDALFAAGLDEQAIHEALVVAFCFGVIDRLADAFAFPLPDARAQVWGARILMTVGYAGGAVPG
jgi:alkylhydroperoxidase family enzyme